MPRASSSSVRRRLTLLIRKPAPERPARIVALDHTRRRDVLVMAAKTTPAPTRETTP